MHTRRCLFAALIFLSAWTLTGCFQIEQEIHFNSDGSGYYMLDLGVRTDQIDETAVKSGLTLNRLVAELENNPYTTKPILTEKYSQDGYTHIKMTAQASDLCAFLEDLGAGGSPLFQYNLVEENGGYFLLKQYLYPVQEQWQIPDDPQIRAQLAAALADSYWTVRISAPRVRTPGRQFDNFIREVEYRVRLTDLVAGDRKVIKTHLRPQPIVPEKWLWLIVTGLLTVLALVFTIATFRLIPQLKYIPPRAAPVRPVNQQNRGGIDGPNVPQSA